MPGIRGLSIRDNKNPCKECHEKGESYLGCHGKCEKYKNWSEEHRAKQQETYRNKQNHVAIDVYQRQEKARYRRSRGL